MSDPELKKWDVIILDECHERTTQTDILMGMLKSLAVKRPDLKLVFMSATLDTEKYLEYFENPPFLHVSGRL